MYKSQVIKGADDFQQEIYLAQAHVTATIEILKKIQEPINKQGQGAEHGWRDHHLGPVDAWESLKNLVANAEELLSYLDIMQENIEEIKRIRDEWVQLGDAEEAKIDEKIIEQRKKCQSADQQASLVGTDTDATGITFPSDELPTGWSWANNRGTRVCEKGSEELTKWREALEALRKEKQAWADWGTETQFSEMAGDVIPSAFVGQVMKRTFKEQCLLLANVYNIARHKAYVVERQEKARLPYVATGSINANACLMAQREPWGFLNQLTQDKSYRSFFDIRPELLSQLSPMIRLYKIESQASGAPERQVEVTFDTHYSDIAHAGIDNILQNKDKRGFGVGLKSLSLIHI